MAQSAGTGQAGLSLGVEAEDKPMLIEDISTGQDPATPGDQSNLNEVIHTVWNNAAMFPLFQA
jgi:hypothetical protein